MFQTNLHLRGHGKSVEIQYVESAWISSDFPLLDSFTHWNALKCIEILKSFTPCWIFHCALVTPARQLVLGDFTVSATWSSELPKLAGLQAPVECTNSLSRVQTTGGIMLYWLVVQCAHLEKWWTSWMGLGWHPIYEMENKFHVPNHQPVL